MDENPVASAASLVVAAIIAGAMIYYVPLLFIGILIGYILNSGKKSILKLQDESDEPIDTTDLDKEDKPTIESNNRNEDDKH